MEANAWRQKLQAGVPLRLRQQEKMQGLDEEISCGVVVCEWLDSKNVGDGEREIGCVATHDREGPEERE
jgi:hypothetical protein